MTLRAPAVLLWVSIDRPLPPLTPLTASPSPQMVMQCGVESAPADLSAYAVVRFVREKLDCPVADFVFAVHEMK